MIFLKNILTFISFLAMKGLGSNGKMSMYISQIVAKVHIILKYNFRWNSQTMDDMQRMREREREMNLMKNMKNMHQPMDGGVYLNP